MGSHGFRFAFGLFPLHLALCHPLWRYTFARCFAAPGRKKTLTDFMRKFEASQLLLQMNKPQTITTDNRARLEEDFNIEGWHG